MRLNRYDYLNPQIGIRRNLQKYVNDISGEIAKGKTPLAKRKYYPKDLRKIVLDETEGDFNLKVPEIKPRKQIKLTSSQKGKNRYITNRK